MALVPIKAPLRTCVFICESCSRTLRARRNPHFRISNPPRTSTPFSTTSPLRTSRPLRPQQATFTAHRTSNARTQHRPPRRDYATNPTISSLRHEKPLNIAPLHHRRLISLSGADAPKFLQGLITNNVDPGVLSPFYAAFLDARGRVLWDVFIWPQTTPGEAWGCYIEVDGGELEALLRHLKKHKLRSKINLRTLDADEVKVWADWAGVTMHMDLPAGNLAFLTDPRAPFLGTRFLLSGPGSENLPELDEECRVQGTGRQYQVWRYINGVPEGPAEIPREIALPMESNIDLSGGIDFRKGCYVGQELTIRTKHTGVVRKRILPVQLYHTGEELEEDGLPRYDPAWTGEVDIGADIKELNGEGEIKKGRAAGKLLAGIGNVGLALCRLEMMTSWRVSAEGGSWKPGVEFGLQGKDGVNGDGRLVRVKAIVPPWLRVREKEIWEKGRSQHG